MVCVLETDVVVAPSLSLVGKRKQNRASVVGSRNNTRIVVEAGDGVGVGGDDATTLPMYRYLRAGWIYTITSHH